MLSYSRNIKQLISLNGKKKKEDIILGVNFPEPNILEIFLFLFTSGLCLCSVNYDSVQVFHLALQIVLSLSHLIHKAEFYLNY